jgi:hypothetical protein
MELLGDIQWSRGQTIDIKERNIIVHLLGAVNTVNVNKRIERW